MTATGPNKECQPTSLPTDEASTHKANFTKVHLAGLHARYKRTKNPLYAWAAICWCHGEFPRTEIPEWCLDYFAEAGAKLNSLMPNDYSWETGGKGRQMMGVVPTSDKMTKAMGLTSGGRNAFRDAWSESRSARAAGEYLDLRHAGWSAKDALLRTMEWLGVDDEAQAQKIIREGKRLLTGKT